jgi:hypothetical protein
LRLMSTAPARVRWPRVQVDTRPLSSAQRNWDSAQQPRRRVEGGGGGGGGGYTLPTITRPPRGSGHAAQGKVEARACVYSACTRVRVSRRQGYVGSSVNMKSSFCKVNFKVKYQQVEVIPRYRCEVGDI